MGAFLPQIRQISIQLSSSAIWGVENDRRICSNLKVTFGSYVGFFLELRLERKFFIGFQFKNSIKTSYLESFLRFQNRRKDYIIQFRISNEKPNFKTHKLKNPETPHVIPQIE